MSIKDFWELLILLFAPIIAVIITILYNKYERNRAQRVTIFATLYSRKDELISSDVLHNLQMIRIFFASDKEVIRLFDNWLEPTHPNYHDTTKRTDYLHLLLLEMAKVLGYNEIKLQHLQLIYFPDGLALPEKLVKEINEEVLRVLKNSEHYSSTPRKPNYKI